MTRPPNKRVTRGRPVRRASGPAKGGGCLAMVLILIAAPILTAIVAVVAFGTSRLEMAASHSAVAINGAPLTHADAGNSVGTASGLVFIGLGFAFLFVSLPLPHARRHRPWLRVALGRVGAGHRSPAPTPDSPERPAVLASATG